ncbi:zinc finger BED domain-containing protein 5-like [Tachypleus tridentatus]|uniref:zinc finger BED domain-containing protein 5-like n=1 Tax=Tachypleus tridentatus TaxID=6853 RepID=UPI003FCFDBB5
MEAHEIQGQLCSSSCTDGVATIIGKSSGAVARIKKKNPNIESIHCCLHRHAFAMKRMPEDLKEVLGDVTKIVNFIKSRSLNVRIFSLLCEDMGSLHKHLLLHTEIRWLSRGKVLARFYKLCEEIGFFLCECYFELAYKLRDKCWIQKVAYLSDVFAYLNESNATMQGTRVTYFKVQSKMEALQRKLKLWGEYILTEKLECLENLSGFLFMNEISLSEDTKVSVLQHISGLCTTIGEYFPPHSEQLLWIQNPFVDSANTNDLPLKEKEQLIEISTDDTLRTKFQQEEMFDSNDHRIH